MSKKFKTNSGGLVYSTDPNFQISNDDDAVETLAPAHQKLRIQLEKNHRGGKVVSVITGFVGSDADIEQLAKQLKNSCGTGGSAKDGEIIIQGDHRDKILALLQKWGYTNTKKAGG